MWRLIGDTEDIGANVVGVATTTATQGSPR